MAKGTGKRTFSLIGLERIAFGHLARHQFGIPEALVEGCLAEQRDVGGRLGEICVQKGLLTRDQIFQILRLQARSVVSAANAATDSPLLPYPTSFSLCMPAYNEEANIEDTLDSACSALSEFVQRFEIVIANDGSKDGTAEAVTRYARRDSRVRLVNLEKNLGYGGALRSALGAARGDLIAFTDSDGQFSMLDLPRLLSHIGAHDVVVGYRCPRADPWYRSLNAIAWTRLIRILFGVRVRDLDCAFKLLRREVLDGLELTANGAAINAQIMAQVFRAGIRIREVPVGHYPRYRGVQTGANLKVITRAFSELPGLWKYRTEPIRMPEPVPAVALNGVFKNGNGVHVPVHRNGVAGQAIIKNGFRTVTGGSNGHGSKVLSSNDSVISPSPKEAPARPLRICMLAACPFPANHGTPGSIREMSEGLAEIGHEVHIVTYHMGEDIPVRGTSIHRIPRLTRESAVVVGPTVRKPIYDLLLVFTALKVIERHQIDVIHAQGYEATLAGWLCRLLTGVPVVYSGHNIMAPDLPGYGIGPRWFARGLGRLLDATVPRLADRLLPHSHGLEHFFSEMGLSARSESVVNFGIDLCRFPQGNRGALRERYGLSDEPIVLYAGVLDEFQRLDLLLEAMAQVARQEHRAKLFIVQTIASDRHLARLRRQIAELGLENHVIITEPQCLQAAQELLAVADVAVASRPRTPGFSIKLLNYLAARKPCVLFASSAGSGLSQANAYLAAPDSAKALAQGILQVLTDRSLSQRLAENGYKFLQANHDRHLVARRIVKAYERTLDWLDRAVMPAQHGITVNGQAKRAEHGRAAVQSTPPERAQVERAALSLPIAPASSAVFSDRFTLEALCELGA